MTQSAQIDNLISKYGKEKVEKAVAFLSYKNPTPLPKCDENTDKPTLYVFRHGQTTDNADFIFSGWRDPDLTDLGIKQALELAPKLQNKKIDEVYVSDQKRSLLTAKYALSLNEKAKGLEFKIDPRLKERKYGDLQGHSKLEAYLENPELVALERRSYDFVPPNGESVQMVVLRVKNFLEELLPRMKDLKINVAISCHGNSIRGFRQVFEGLSNDQTAHVETVLGSDFASYVVE